MRSKRPVSTCGANRVVHSGDTVPKSSHTLLSIFMLQSNSSQQNCPESKAAALKECECLKSQIFEVLVAAQACENYPPASSISSKCLHAHHLVQPLPGSAFQADLHSTWTKEFGCGQVGFGSLESLPQSPRAGCSAARLGQGRALSLLDLALQWLRQLCRRHRRHTWQVCKSADVCKARSSHVAPFPGLPGLLGPRTPISAGLPPHSQQDHRLKPGQVCVSASSEVGHRGGGSGVADWLPAGRQQLF